MFSYLETIDELIAENKYDVIIKSDLDVVWIDSVYDELNRFIDSNLPIAMSRECVNYIHYKANDTLLHYQHLANGGYFCAGITLYNAHVLANGVYNHTSVPIPKGKDVYAIHYNVYAKPFGKVSKQTVGYLPLSRTYKLYQQIAETINCDIEFITLLKNNLQKLSELTKPYYSTSPTLQILNIKLTNMLKGMNSCE